MKKYKFQAQIEAGDGGGAFVFFPYDVQKEFGTTGKVPVNATFDGVPYTGSLIKYGFPQHTLGVLKAIRQQIGKGPGETVDVAVWRDEAVRKLEVPPEFEELMREEGVFDSLTDSATPTARNIVDGSPRPRKRKRE